MISEQNYTQEKWYKPVRKSTWKSLTQTWPEGSKFDLWSPQLESSSITWFGGIDVHLKKLTLAVFGKDKDSRHEKILGPIISVNATIDGYQRLFTFFDFFDPQRILMETTGVYSFDPYHRCVNHYPSEPGSNRVICMNAHDLSKLLVKNKKTDKVDAARLSFLAGVPELLRESYIPTREEYQMRFILRQRNKYNSEYGKIKNRIKTFLAAGGFRWRFNYRVKGEVAIIEGFIHQTMDFGSYITSLETSSTINKYTKLAVSKYGEVLVQWADYRNSDMERLILTTLFGLLEKQKGLIDLYDKFLYEAIINKPKYRESWDLLQDMPGAGIWVLATIILESGPISRFHRVGGYLSYIGVTKTIHESAKISKKKGNNPHSHRILKQAYRTIGITLLGMVIRDSNLDKVVYHQFHPLIEYARKINMHTILNGQKANKIAAKAGRIVYGILKSKKPYDCFHEYPKSKNQNELKNEITRVVRHSFLENQIDLLRISFQTLTERSNLTEEPFIKDLLTSCQKVIALWNTDPLLVNLRKSSNRIRTIKKHSQKSKEAKKIQLKDLTGGISNK